MWHVGRMRPETGFLVTGESFLNCRKCCKSPASSMITVIPAFFSRLLYNEIDFFGLRKIYIDQFGPSNFLSCADLVELLDLFRVLVR